MLRSLGLVLVIGFFTVGCSLQTSLLDFNPLMAPQLTDQNLVKVDSLTLNSSSDTSHTTFLGVCPSTSSTVSISVASENSFSGFPKTVSTPCTQGTYSSTLDASSWPDGNYIVTSSTSSSTGVVSSSTVKLVKDQLAPVVTITNTVPTELGQALVGSVSITGTCESSDGNIRFFDGSLFIAESSCNSNSFNSTLALSGLTEGTHQITARQTDAAGNSGNAFSNSFNKDTIPPLLLPSLSGLGAALSNNTATRNLTVSLPSDGGTYYKYVIVKNSDCSGTHTALLSQARQNAGQDIPLTFSGDGTYRVCVVAGDQADNWSAASAVYESTAVTIDTAAPSLAWTSPIASSRHQSSATLTGTCEALLPLTITGDFITSPLSLTCSAGGNFSTSVTFTSGEGNKTFTASSTDGAGNIGNSSTLTLVRDNSISLPSVVMETSTNMTTANSLFTYQNCSDHKFVLIKDTNSVPAANDSAWQSCNTTNSGFSFDLSANGGQQGLRTIRFYAKDEAGNISTSTSFTVLYDTLAPQISFDPIPTLAIGISYPFVLYITEANIASSATVYLDYSTDGGSTWNAATSASLGTAGPINNKKLTINWAPPNNPSLRMRARVTDTNGLEGIGITSAFAAIIDITKPTLTASQFKINNELSPSSIVRPYVLIDLEARDNETAVTKFCLKTANIAPTASDSCWVSVKAPKPGLSEAPILSLNDFDFYLGITFQTYSVYAWAMDVAGNISDNAAIPQKDVNSVTYINDPSPQVSDLLTVNSSNPNQPPLTYDMTFANGQNVFIKWKASDNNSIQDISAYYTFDGLEYFLIQSGLNNSSNGSCTFSGPHTGCFNWSSSVPNDTYFRIQLRVTDDYGQTSQVTSPPLNSGNFNLLAGNQDPGHNGDAKKTVFSVVASTNTVPGTLLVSTDGKVFFNDSNYGVMYINPVTNNSKILIPLAKENESNIGDGVPVSAAKVKNVYRMALDYQNNLLLYDFDRIRKVNTNVDPMTIETIIGADPSGNLGTNDADTVADPRDVKITIRFDQTINERWAIASRAIFQPMPNGDLYFISEKPGLSPSEGARIRIYKGSLSVPRVDSQRWGGTGVKDLPAWDLNTQPVYTITPRFDPVSSAISFLFYQGYYFVPGNAYGNGVQLDPVNWNANGIYPNHPIPSQSLVYYPISAMDGRIYRVNRYTSYEIVKLNDDGVTWSRVLGTGVSGDCVDGTPALSCNVTVDDAFVDRYGRLFFSARGIIKTVFNGNVYTLFGQRKDAGDGGSAFDMRISSIQFFDHDSNDGIVMIDHQEGKMRSISPSAVGSQVQTIAGTGTYASVNVANLAASEPIPGGAWNTALKFATNPANGDVYTVCTIRVAVGPPEYHYSKICRLNRATGYWSVLVGGEGGTLSSVQSAIALSDLNYSSYPPEVTIFKDNRLLVNNFYWNGTAHNDTHLRLLDLNTNISSYVGGMIGVTSESCPDGSNTSCGLGPTGSHAKSNPSAFTPLNGWMVNPWRTLWTNNPLLVFYGSSVKKIFDFPERVANFTFADNKVFYCTFETGKLYKVEFNSLSDLSSTSNWPLIENTHFTRTEMSLPGGNSQCIGQKMIYKPAQGNKPARIIFGVKQNGLPAFGEYFL